VKTWPVEPAGGCGALYARRRVGNHLLARAALPELARGAGEAVNAATPTRAELEDGISRYLSLQPAHETKEGKLYVKVTDIEPVNWPPDSKQFRAGLFLSVPFLGGERTKLDQALARIRKGFKRNEILAGWQVGLSDEKPYSHRDEELGTALLTLPVVLTLEPAS
jgi:hypothetical protein